MLLADTSEQLIALYEKLVAYETLIIRLADLASIYNYSNDASVITDIERHTRRIEVETYVMRIKTKISETENEIDVIKETVIAHKNTLNITIKLLGDRVIELCGFIGTHVNQDGLDNAHAELGKAHAELIYCNNMIN